MARALRLGGNGGSGPTPHVKRQVKNTKKGLPPVDYSATGRFTSITMRQSKDLVEPDQRGSSFEPRRLRHRR
eukprot:1258142-Prymnesium_polylepis.1